MSPNYTYRSSIDYINGLTYGYVETYSFQRGTEYELQQRRYKDEFQALKVRKAKFNDLATQQEQQLIRLHGLCDYTQYLLDDNNQFHYSSKKTNTFNSADSTVELLRTILRTEIKDIPSWLCSPLYRDAFVFYNNMGAIVSVLNVCLSCQYMETTKFNHINGDYKTYDLLKRFFIDIGHEVEDPEKFPLGKLKN